MTGRSTAVRRVGMVFIGGVVGSGLRWAANEVAGGGSLPWDTFAVNVVGAAVLGLLLPRLLALPGDRAVLVVAIGFLGALTTFSALAVDVVALVDDGRATAGVGYLLGTVAAGLVVASVGYRIGSRE